MANWGSDSKTAYYCTRRNTFWNSENELFDVELRIVVIEVKNVEVQLESAEERGWTQKCNVETQSADGRRYVVADLVAVDLASDRQHAAGGVHLKVLAVYTNTWENRYLTTTATSAPIVYLSASHIQCGRQMLSESQQK